MPTTPTYPGVYIEEVSSGVRTITPVATSITAFVGAAPRGLANDPQRVQSFAEYTRMFGGLVVGSPMSYAVSQYFQNGGSDALIVRVTPPDATAAAIGAGGLALEAASPGAWGNGVKVRVDLQVRPPRAGEDEKPLFNLFAFDPASGALESFRNVSSDPEDPRFVSLVLEEQSSIVRVPKATPPSGRPSEMGAVERGKNWFESDGAYATGSGGVDGSAITEAHILGDQDAKTGLYALEKTELFNLLCLPPAEREGEIGTDTYAAALAYCAGRRAMLLADPPASWGSVATAANQISDFRSSLGGEIRLKNAAIYFPRLRMPDPLKENRVKEFVPCGALAGVFARTDVQRGVWKSPAGTDAGLSGVTDFTVKMNDPENGRLNVEGVNCLRNFRAFGNVVWGARTLAGSDQMGSEWKYVAVRRFALFLEESLYRGTQWVVFEPNDEPLWAQIRLNIGAFLQGLFRQGAFQGRSRAEAYFVKCDKETTTQNDINRGIVNIEVGFAPLKPAEFVIIKIQQIAGKIET
jgi:phage tail sheath protein FI